jgi:peptidoglycan hydrolase CwlO-like protein
MNQDKDNKMFTITRDTLKTFCQGALGSMTFGAYHLYVSTEMMKMNNRYFEKEIQEQQREIQTQHKQMEEQQKKIEKQHIEIEEQQRTMKELYKEVQAIKQRRWWFY